MGATGGEVLLWPLSCKPLLASAFRCLKKHIGTSGTAASGNLRSAGTDLGLPFVSFGTGVR